MEAPLAAPADWHKLLTADARTALPAEFVARMDELRLMPLYELLEELFTLFDMGRIGKQDAYLFSFFDAVTEYLQNNSSDLDGFIRYWDETLCNKTIPSGEMDGIRIFSIHKSKGLEFPVVFLSNLSRRFNTESQCAQILCDRDLGMGLSVADSENRVRYSSIAKRAIAAKMAAESLSEELRVLYVAMTRARDRLIMTYAEKNPGKIIQNIALRQDFDGGELLCREAARPGQWVLLAAVRHTEAGALHALGGRPGETKLGDHPWVIRVSDAPESEDAVGKEMDTRSAMPDGVEQALQEALSFQYAYDAATRAPSKQTAA